MKTRIETGCRQRHRERDEFSGYVAGGLVRRSVIVPEINAERNAPDKSGAHVSIQQSPAPTCGEAGRRRAWNAWRDVARQAAVAGLLFAVVGCPAAAALAQSGLPDAGTSPATAIATALLDAAQDQKAREALARDASSRATDVVRALVDGLPDGDETEEYRRIPWIWRVAVGAGRAKDEAALKPLLDFSMPREGAPLRDWQAVVLGGGVVMGLSQAGTWPGDVMAPWLAEDATRARRWARSLDLAVGMVDNATVRNGTRYDALRMLAVLPWDRSGALLERYLSAEVDPELQMGAIGGLSDLQDDRAGETLVRHFARYTETNRRHALNALLRTDQRRALLRDAIARGVVKEEWLTPEQRQKLTDR